MSSTSGGSYDCQLCQNTYDNKVALTVHFCKHLSYKKYPCNSCRESFYTEDDRGEHCQKANHDNMYTVKSSPYCEMLVNQLLKDAKLLTIYDMNVIVAKRAKKNFEFEHELRDCEQKVKKEQPRTPRKSSPTRKTEPSPSPRSRKNSPAPGKSRKDSAEEKTRKEPSPVKSRKETKVKGILKRTYSETASEETNEAAATATTNETKKKRHSSQSVTETTPKRAAETPKEPILKLPNSSDVKFPCGLCNRKVPSDYVSRKDHVSRKHMTTDHSDEDYVPILEAQMKKAFVDWTHSDLDCQLCRKQYKTVSGRREHAAKSHLPERLSCPIAACPFASESSAMVNKHLKQVHDLEDGYKSLDDADERKAFEAKLRQHNQQLAEITKHCFPCLIPVFYQCSTKKTGTPKNAEPLLNVSRIFQSTPMSRPLRRQSESTDSDESTHRDDPAFDHQAASPETAETETAENDMNGSESPLVFDSVDIKNVQLLQEPARGWASTTEEQSQPETTSPMEEDDDIVFVREKNKRKIKKSENIVVKEEVAEDANPIQLPAEPAYLHQQFTLPPMNLQPQAPTRFTTVSPALSDLHLQGSYTSQSSLVHQERGALSDDQRDQYASHRSQTSRSPRAFRHKDYRDQRSWSMSRSFRDRGGYRGGHCRSDERRNSENHSSYTLQRERSLPRGSNQFSYGFRLRGSGSDRYCRERQREGSERPRSSREPDRGQDDNRHYRNPSGQRPTYSILPK